MNIHIYRHIYINKQLKYFAVHLILTQNCNSTTLQLKKNPDKWNFKEFVVCRPTLQECKRESSGCKYKDAIQLFEDTQRNKEHWKR